MATIDNCCWFHDQSSPQDWARVTAAMHKAEPALRFVDLMMTHEGLIKLSSKFGGMQEALEKAAESLNDMDLLPVDSDYERERRNLDGSVTPIEEFSWYRYASRVRYHLLAVFKQKKDVRYWFQEAA